MLLYSLAKHSCSPKKHWNIALACKTVTFSHKTFTFSPKNCICPQNLEFTCTIFTLSHKTFAFPRETLSSLAKPLCFFGKLKLPRKKHCICCQNFVSSTKRLHFLAKLCTFACACKTSALSCKMLAFSCKTSTFFPITFAFSPGTMFCELMENGWWK